MRHFARSISADVVIALLLVGIQQPASHATQPEKKVPGTVTGRVTLDGEPVRKARVVLSSEGMPSGRSGIDPITSTTNEDGVFRLTGVQPGGFLVNVVANIGILTPDQFQPSGRAVVVHEGEQLTLELPLVRGGVITGKIVRADGSPLIGQIVIVVPVRNGARPDISRRLTAESDDRGIYRIFNCPPGEYLVSFIGTFSTARLNEIYYPGRLDPTKAVVVTVVASTEVENVDIKVEELSSTYSVTGQVIDEENGKPSTGLSVFCVSSSVDSRRTFVTKTTSNGDFVFQDLIAGRYKAFVRNDIQDRISQEVDFEVIDKDIISLNLVLPRRSSNLAETPSSVRAQTTDSNQSDGSTRGISLGSITGVVVTDSGRPLADVSVSATSIKTEVGYATVSADAKGRFRIDDLPGGEYRLLGYSAGYRFPGEGGGRLAGVYRPGESVRLVMSKAGVITGKVVDAEGDPVVGVTVRAIMFSGSEGNRRQTIGGSRTTDDRGIYRIYGLAAGEYVLSAGGSGQLGSQINGYQNDAPTFFPSTDREGASEIKVGLGEEIAGIDIVYRHEKGHTIRGTIVGPAGVNSTVTPELLLLKSNGFAVVSQRTVRTEDQEGSFTIRGVPNGDYVIVARASFVGSRAEALATLHVNVAGADVSGLRIKLRQLSSIKGVVQVQRQKGSGSLACQPVKLLLQREMTLIASQEARAPGDRLSIPSVPTEAASRVDEAWQFDLMNIIEGIYRPRIRLDNPAWYVTSVGLGRPAAGASSKPVSADVMVSGIPLDVGESVSGLVVTVSDGAAGVNGRVVVSGSGAFPSMMVVTLVPAEPGAGNDVLRYRQVVTREDGRFSVANLTPGQYWFLAKPLEGGDTTDIEARPSYWNSAVRARLRQEAEKLQKVFELKLCQRLDGVVIASDAASNDGRQ